MRTRLRWTSCSCPDGPRSRLAFAASGEVLSGSPARGSSCNMRWMARFQAAVVLVMLVAAALTQGRQATKSRSSPPASPKPADHSTTALLEAGAIRDGVYNNSAFGLSYKLPYGWVDRTSDMQDDTAEASKSRVLLAVFERPPEASSDTVNSAVVIAAESLFGGIKTAAEYFESLSAPIVAKGFQAEADPHDFSVGTMRLVRGDFSKARGKLTVRQTSLVMLQKGYAVSFTFIGGSADEVNELIEKLSFVPRKPQH